MRSLSWAGLMALASVAGGCGDSGGAGGAGGSGPGTTTGSTTGAGGDPCTPATEICDGQDNDCDDEVDEVPGGCDCNDGEMRDCYSGRPPTTEGVGECQAGTQACVDGKWGACEGEVTPEMEACNLLDDDCNGTPDDMGTASCGFGGCMATVEVCVDGQLQVCVPGVPTLEVCDGVDNNCNLITDESDPQVGAACDSGLLGICQPGTFACTMAMLVCNPNQMPGSEQCDDLDNDCNGSVDDNVPGTGGTCNTGLPGVCAPGTIACQNSVIDCYPDTPPSAEVCDLLDNDCNGSADDGDPEGGAPCNTGQPGICGPGTEHCVNGLVQCVPNATASPEVCNGIDDNCEGNIDEGNPGGGVACGCQGQGTTACVGGSVVCQGGPTVFFSDDFNDNSAGWTLDAQWQIAPAVASSGCFPGQDPATDHTPTADNGVAGVVIGGCTGTALHPDYCMTSPVINTSSAPASVFLNFWRDLGSDYQNFANSHIDVSSNGGTSWTQIFGTPCCSLIDDSAWTFQSYDVTAYKSANFRVRFCYNITGSGVYNMPSWSVDDLNVATASCQ